MLILLALSLSIRYPPALEFGYTGSFHEGSFCCFSLLSLLPFSTLIIRVWLRLAQSFQESLSCGPHMALLLSLAFVEGPHAIPWCRAAGLGPLSHFEGDTWFLPPRSLLPAGHSQLQLTALCGCSASKHRGGCLVCEPSICLPLLHVWSRGNVSQCDFREPF